MTDTRPEIDAEAEADSRAADTSEARETEISFDEQRYPARPQRLRPRGRLRGLFPRFKKERAERQCDVRHGARL